MYPLAREYTFSIYCHRRTIVYSYTIQTRRAVLFGQHGCDEHCVPTGHKYNIITLITIQKYTVIVVSKVLI